MSDPRFLGYGGIVREEDGFTRHTPEVIKLENEAWRMADKIYEELKKFSNKSYSERWKW